MREIYECVELRLHPLLRYVSVFIYGQGQLHLEPISVVEIKDVTHHSQQVYCEIAEGVAAAT